MDQPGLFDPTPVAATPLPNIVDARRERDAAMALVDGNTFEAWKVEALDTILGVARHYGSEGFTSDDVWDAGLTKAGVNPKALGPVILTACRAGWIRKHTPATYRQSRYRHATPLVVWVQA